MALACAPQANATLQLTLSSGGTTVTIDDFDVFPDPIDSCPLANCITWVGVVGNWSLNVSTGVAGTNPLMHLNRRTHLRLRHPHALE